MDAKISSKHFKCVKCEFSTHYDYFGSKPPFYKDLILLEDAYIMKDPFTMEANFIVLGGHCSFCNIAVCCNQKCSIFYTKRICLACCLNHFDDFPPAIKQDLQKIENSD
ncbi:cysteine-rich DPF motif domain-containing protein 1-like [Xenia sp. Carnegie-2017]|uniref:cysteine-rich DPF motif domain-containing protein 1-like n=1 Tax=Xenia sp. Carnegie-2017 TaxID=2897299 RepID=UPI001F046454|nr:cysteine-rich DPF motif domain-containing protein 1-like [Xenia sp. Carnegie-2017]